MAKIESGSVSRRGFLKSGALLAGASALGFSGVFGLRTARAADDDIPTILSIAATAEAFAVTHYLAAINSKIPFTAAQKAYLRAGLESEYDHLQFLMANGGKMLTDKFYIPTGTFASTKSFGAVTAIAETVFVGAYLAATRRFAELNQPLLAATAAQVAVIEGQHLALVREIGGEFPNNLALAEPLFYNVSDAVAVVQPLLDGKKGGLGEMDKDPVPYPSEDKIKAAIGKSALKPGVMPFTEMKAGGMMAATMEPTVAK
ncbi:MAG: ferritin-like domain-containing protein [Chloroflexota bacterium]